MAEGALSAAVVADKNMELGGGAGVGESAALRRRDNKLLDGQLELRADGNAGSGGAPGRPGGAATGGGEDDVLVTEPVLGMRMLMSSRVSIEFAPDSLSLFSLSLTPLSAGYPPAMNSFQCPPWRVPTRVRVRVSKRAAHTLISAFPLWNVV